MEQHKLSGIQFSQVIGGKIKDNKIISGYSHTNLTPLSGNMKIALDANILISAILNKDFYNFLYEESKSCPIFVTEINKVEAIKSLGYDGHSKEGIIAKFENLKNTLNIVILPVYDGCEADAFSLFDIVTKNIKIKKIGTFLSDCTTLVILKKNNINVFYSNDGDLGEVCRKFLPSIQVRKILDEKELRIKEVKKVNRMFKDILPKFKYCGQKHKARR